MRKNNQEDILKEKNTAASGDDYSESKSENVSSVPSASKKKKALLITAICIVLVLVAGIVFMYISALRSSISEESAKKVAFYDAGVKEENAMYVQSYRTVDDMKLVYEITFRVDNRLYEYTILAKNGKIVDREIEGDGFNKPKEEDSPDQSNFTETTSSVKNNKTPDTKEIKETALKDAGISIHDVRSINCQKQNDQNYKVVFISGGEEFTYIVSGNLQIIEKNSETIKKIKEITENEAQAIAFANAGVSEKDVVGLESEYDYDDGVYDIEFIAKSREYDYKIDIFGNIVDSEISIN